MNPQTTIAVTFLSHNISAIGGVLWHHFYMIFIHWFLEWPYFLGFCIAKKEAIWWKGWVVHFLFANGRERSNYCPNSILSATQEWMHIHSDSACIWVVHKLRWNGKVGRLYWKYLHYNVHIFHYNSKKKFISNVMHKE